MNLADLYKAAGMTITGATTKHIDAGSINQFPDKLKNVSSVGNVNATAGGTNRLELFNGTAYNMCPVTTTTGSEEEGNLKTETHWVAVKSDDNPSGVDLADCDSGSIPVLGLVKNSVYTEGDKACGVAAGVACDNGGVVAFDIYLKLDNNSTVSLAPGSYLKNTTNTDYGLRSTMRVAFVTLGTQPNDYYSANSTSIDNKGVAHFTGATEENDSYLKNFKGYAGAYGARSMNAFGSINVWEPNSGYHTKGGINNAINNYEVAEADIDETKDVTTHGIHTLIPEVSLPMRLSEANATDNADYFAEQKLVGTADVGTGKPYKNLVKYFKATGDTLENSQQLFSAAAGVTKVRVYMWVEGNDIDTENNATSSKIQAMLSFTTADTKDDLNESDLETYTNPLAAVYRNGFAGDTIPSGSFEVTEP
ncbi:MAG TPA: hypothetical protein DCE23_06465 [Firmicutes bacterium]|nr:hypothetical protein [Bacillota bacterium]